MYLARISRVDQNVIIQTNGLQCEVVPNERVFVTVFRPWSTLAGTIFK